MYHKSLPMATTYRFTYDVIPFEYGREMAAVDAIQIEERFL